MKFAMGTSGYVGSIVLTQRTRESKVRDPLRWSLGHTMGEHDKFCMPDKLFKLLKCYLTASGQLV